MILVFCMSISACKVTYQQKPHIYNYESDYLRSIEMSDEENEYLDFRLSRLDSIPHYRWNGSSRPVVHRNTKSVLRVGFGDQENKMIVSKFCVDRKGVVVYAELDPKTDALIPEGGVRDVLKGISGYKVAPDTLAPLVECGLLTIRIKKINSIN